MAERYGLISEIDCWVVRHAAERAAEGMAVGVNLSGASVGDPVVMAAIERALAETEADPSLLMFEVTETALVERTDEGRAFVERLTALGCRFALDDFGTGFGTFVYLKHLPVDYLKIDMQFVRDLLRDDDDERVVRSIVGLARDFGKKTIGEGVEDEATLQRLRDLGVDYAQGFHIGRPAPTHELERAATAARAEAADAPDRIALVRRVFDGFVRRDLDAIEQELQPDVELRPIGTARRAGRTAPYRGYGISGGTSATSRSCGTRSRSARSCSSSSRTVWPSSGRWSLSPRRAPSPTTWCGSGSSATAWSPRFRSFRADAGRSRRSAGARRRDRLPRRGVGHELAEARAHARIAVEGAEPDAHLAGVPGVAAEQARPAVGAEELLEAALGRERPHQVLALGDPQAIAVHPHLHRGGGAGPPPAARAMAVEGETERRRHLESHRPAHAAAE